MTRARLVWGLAGVAFLGAATWAVFRADLRGNARDIAGGVALGSFLSSILVWSALFVRHLVRDRDAMQPSPTLYDQLAVLHKYLDSKPELAKYKALGEKLYWLKPEDIDRREALLADLARHPFQAEYHDRIVAGERITASMVGYWRDPSMRALCEHLVEVEGALRAHGSGQDPCVTSEGLYFHGALDFERLQAQFALPEWVVYSERQPDPRGGLGSARLYCRQCECSIVCQHPEDTPVIFPSR